MKPRKRQSGITLQIKVSSRGDAFSTSGPILLRDSRPLPEDWTKSNDANSGRDYFYHAKSGTSTWQHPDDHGFFKKTLIWRREKQKQQEAAAEAAGGGASGRGASGSGRTASGNGEGSSFLPGLFDMASSDTKGSPAEKKKLAGESKEELEQALEELRKERKAREGAEESLLLELQRRRDRIATLEESLADERVRLAAAKESRDRQKKVIAQMEQALSGIQAAKNPTSAEANSAAADEVKEGLDEEEEEVAALSSELDSLAVKEQAAEARFKEFQQLQEAVTAAKTVVQDLDEALTATSEEEGEEAVIQKSFHQAATANGIAVQLLAQIIDTPWEPQVLEQLAVEDKVVEWQSWSIFHHWSGAGAGFPSNFHPILEADDQSQPPTSLFTDEAISTVVDLHQVALPGDAWEWIGSWRMENEGPMSDNEGWCYSKALDDELHSQAGGLPHSPNLKLRRRTWRRLRMVLRLPGMSGASARAVEMAGRIASLEVMTRKLTEQLLEAQASLNDADQEAFRLQHADEDKRKAEAELVKARRRLSDLEKRFGADNAESKNEQAIAGFANQASTMSPSATTAEFPPVGKLDEDNPDIHFVRPESVVAEGVGGGSKHAGGQASKPPEGEASKPQGGEASGNLGGAASTESKTSTAGASINIKGISLSASDYDDL